MVGPPSCVAQGAENNNVLMTDPTDVSDVRTPALLVDEATFDQNLAAMDGFLPGRQLRPHVKAFKSTSMAQRLEANGHPGFCAATPREIEGLVAAGLCDDLLLANETLDTARLGALTDQANITVAVDSDETLEAAIKGGIEKVLIDVEVGLPRCGCDPEDAGRLADRARSAGVDVRGVMGYEGHLMMVHDRAEKTAKVEESMAILLQAHERVGGDIVSGGGTGTFDLNTWCTEIQAGSYMLMDTQYDELEIPFEKALSVLATVVSVNQKGWFGADAGLKAFGMDHGNPSWDGGDVFFCSDEHVTLAPRELSDWSVGERVRIWPAHVDPTVAQHEKFWIVDGDTILDRWEIDLRGW
jgi:D-serine deaminase-like pyridoxal phosphate-dependent protein